MVRKVFAALVVAAAVSGSAAFDALVPPTSPAVADGTGLPKCC